MPRLRDESTGMIQVYTGDGKGKTTAALGQALRAIGHGMKVFMVQFMKGRTYGELLTCERCLPELTIVMSGRDEFVKKGEPEEVDLRMAREGFELAKKVVAEGGHDMLILDEINVAVDYGLLPLQEVLDFLRSCPLEMEIVCTGRYAAQEIIDLADLVSEVREVKHHYNKGVEMRQGIEY
ncbi:MAG: cob(I)yrinic acid a,c-diamide adenosyltransferase [Actinobacteria bacterium]|nr:cob(I)yrinic acid a,c-diamide adenosyltransferase [Actinomycetota bacterium]